MAATKITFTIFGDEERAFLAEWADKQSDIMAHEYWQLVDTDEEKAKHTLWGVGVLATLAQKLRDSADTEIFMV